MVLTPLKTGTPSLGSGLQTNPGERVSSGKGDIEPVVAILTRSLPLPQAQQLAGQTALVRVVKGGPGNQAELEYAGQNIQVKLPPGRMLTAGEMVTVSFALTEKGNDLSAGGAGGARKTADTRNLQTSLPIIPGEDSEAQESPSFVDRLSGSARLIGFLERISQSANTQVSTTVMASLKQITADAEAFGKNVLSTALPAAESQKMAESQLPGKADGRTPVQQNQAPATINASNSSLTGVLAKQVSAAVENSGLFYESHLQQWVNGQRSSDQIAQEPQARFGLDQVISEKGMNPAAVDQSVKLVSAQLATLDNNRISLALAGLLGQPVQIDIEPDDREPGAQQEQADEEGQRPWVARLKLDMAHLGELHVRVRMVGSQCDVQISGPADSKKAVDPHWQQFRQAMENQGLKLVHGQFMASAGHQIGE